MWNQESIINTDLVLSSLWAIRFDETNKRKEDNKKTIAGGNERHRWDGTLTKLFWQQFIIEWMDHFVGNFNCLYVYICKQISCKHLISLFE